MKIVGLLVQIDILPKIKFSIFLTKIKIKVLDSMHYVNSYWHFPCIRKTKYKTSLPKKEQQKSIKEIKSYRLGRIQEEREASDKLNQGTTQRKLQREIVP